MILLSVVFVFVFQWLVIEFFFFFSSNEQLLDVLNSITKAHEESDVLKKDKTKSLTFVMMEQMEGLTRKGRLDSE